MDELVIEDKKYLSTKKAAQKTGYAKDYVGQLCREGRVPARLVGRSWYVLESALADHRFGASEEVPESKVEVEVETKREEAVAPKEYVRYQADDAETIETIPDTKTPEAKAPEQPNIQEVWEAWFERVAQQSTITTENESAGDTSVAETEDVAPEDIQEEELEEIDREAEKVAIHVKPTEEPVQVAYTVKNIRVPVSKLHTEESAMGRRRGLGVPIPLALNIGAGVIATFLLISLVLSTGVFDKTLISFGRDSFIAGVSVYKK